MTAQDRPSTIAIHESKDSDKVVKFVTGVYELEQYCSRKTAIKINRASNNGSLWGVYFTSTGKIRATYR